MSESEEASKRRRNSYRSAIRLVVAVSNHSGWDPGRAFWRSLRHHETVPSRFDIVVDFDGRGNAGDVTTGILLADDDQG
jgi:hypothetical protein